MKIIIRRIYDPGDKSGYRVLVDRLWPRGISKVAAELDDWWKELAPSADLRKWFDHDEKKWTEFRREYRRELTGQKAAVLERLNKVPKKRTLVLLYGAKSEDINQAVVLKEYLEAL
jgi:uncharacterized protein YeaO (DUF488 family)